MKDCFLPPYTHPKIFVVGDLMIDHHVFGHSYRLSPEAPVPVLLVEKETSTLGGAANVAQNLVGYQADVSISGIVGDDDARSRIRPERPGSPQRPTGSPPARFSV